MYIKGLVFVIAIFGISAVTTAVIGTVVFPSAEIVSDKPQSLSAQAQSGESDENEDGFFSFPRGAEFGTEQVLLIDSAGNLSTEGNISLEDLHIGGTAFVDSLNLASALYVAGNNIIDASGRIPTLTGQYIANLNGSALTDVNAATLGGIGADGFIQTGTAIDADKLDGLDASDFLRSGTDVDANKLDGLNASSFLRSDTADVAGGALTLIATPGGANVGGGPLYINPSSAGAGHTLFGIAVNGAERFRVNAEGDVTIAGNLSVAGSTVSTGFAEGSVLFVDSSGNLAQDNDNLFWDGVNRRLGIGISSPATTLYVAGDTTLGNAPGDNLTFFASTLAIPNSLSIDEDTLFIDATNHRVGFGISSPDFKLDVAGKIGIDGTQVVFLPDQTDFSASLVIGTGGTNLSHNSGTEGQSNTFVGIGAGLNTTTGHRNSAFGHDALRNNTTGNGSAFGWEALRNNTTGIENNAFGIRAMRSNTTGRFNTAFGNNALSASNGDSNSAFGNGALTQNTTGDNNSAFGSSALRLNATGQQNIAFGNNALRNNAGGSFNVAVGFSAGIGVMGSTAISNNVLLGHQAGAGLLTGGDNNVLLGHRAGDNLTTGNTNIVIGYDVDAPAVDSTNTLNIGNLIFGNGIDGAGTTLSSGSIGIGINDPDTRLHVKASGTGAIATFESDNNTGCTLSDGGVIACSSDERMKENIQSIKGGLSVISLLNPSTFTWKSSDGRVQTGFIAQQVENVLPHLVMTGSNGYKSLNITGTVPYLVRAVQEQQEQISSLSLTATNQSSYSPQTDLSLEIDVIDDQLKALDARLDKLDEKVSIVDRMRGWFEATADQLSVIVQTVFERPVRFLAGVTFDKSPVFEDQNFAGRAVIPAGGTEVRVTFTEPLPVDDPIITVAPLNTFISAGYNISDISNEGFTIRISEALSHDMVFSWIAVAVANARTEIGATEHQEDADESTEETSETESNDLDPVISLSDEIATESGNVVSD